LTAGIVTGRGQRPGRGKKSITRRRKARQVLHGRSQTNTGTRLSPHTLHQRIFVPHAFDSRTFFLGAFFLGAFFLGAFFLGAFFLGAFFLGAFFLGAFAPLREASFFLGLIFSMQIYLFQRGLTFHTADD